jgi:diguanylate cyclase (GGDEF)-like protein
MNGSTWLCPTPFDRERLVDMEARLARARTTMYGCLSIAFLAGIPWFGWWILIPLAWTAAFYPLIRPWMHRSPHPEYAVAATLVNAQVMIGVGIAVTGGPTSPALPLLLLAVVTMPARFTARGVVAGVILTALVAIVSTVALDPQGYLDDPTYVNAMLGCLGGVAACSYALMRSEVHHRTRAILDPLTGLLNREALPDRFAELAEQAAVTGGSIALVACDLDHFKAINDEHGHERGDTVLREAAYVLRKHLRSFELVYRLGGEEFLIVLPGATRPEAEAIAEHTRVAVEQHRLAGLPVTISMGVVAAGGDAIDFRPLFNRADEALYRAKREGRNRVVALAYEAPRRAPGADARDQRGLDVGPAMRAGMEPGAITATHAAVRVEPTP